MPKSKYRNSRSIDDGDTYTVYDEPSEIPMVSPDAAGTDDRWTSETPDYDFATMQQVTHRGDGDAFVTRRKPNAEYPHALSQ